jgi:hypothetical protein
MNADQSAQLASYRGLCWAVAGRTLAAGALLCLALAALERDAALALAVGLACGVANMVATMRGTERLITTGSPVLFGLSSLLRLAGFSIVAAAVAARGPWWSLGPFLAGFFTPLAAYGFSALRVVRRKP